MKIAVLCTYRTRSSFLTDTLGRFHNITDLWEPYENLTRSVYKKTFNRGSDNLWKVYKNAVPKLTDDFMEKNNYVLKIFNHAYFNSYKLEYYLHLKQDFQFTNDDHLDLIKDFKLDKYDQIYFLDRKNFHDNVISFMFGQQTRMLYAEENKSLLEVHKKTKKLIYDPYWLKVLVTKKMLMPYFLKQLEKLKLPFIKLDYDDVSNYVATNFPNVSTEYIEPNHNYRDLLVNYDEVAEEIEKCKEKVKPFINNLLSQ